MGAPSPIGVAYEPTYRCYQCQDDPNGFVWLRCPATPCRRGACERRHLFVVRCPCWLRRNEVALEARAAKLLERQAKRMPDAIESLWELKKGTSRYAQAVTQ